AVGPDHLETANVCDSLAYNLEHRNDAAAARPYRERCSRIRLSVGGDVPGILGAYRALVANLDSQKLFVEAERGRNRALNYALAAGGPDDPETLGCYIDLGLHYSKFDRFHEEIRVFGYLVGQVRRVRGESHPHTATMLANLGDALSGVGQLERSLRL